MFIILGGGLSCLLRLKDILESIVKFAVLLIVFSVGRRIGWQHPVVQIADGDAGQAFQVANQLVRVPDISPDSFILPQLGFHLAGAC